MSIRYPFLPPRFNVSTAPLSNSADNLGFIASVVQNGLQYIPATGGSGGGGAQGPQGPPGPQGLNGSNGLNGPQGPQGPAGTAGTQGPQGNSGVFGATTFTWNLLNTAVLFNSNTLFKNASASDWDSAGYSAESSPQGAGAFVSFQPNITTSYFTAGLTETSGRVGSNGVDYSWFCNQYGACYVYIFGSILAGSFSYAPQDTFKIVYDGAQVCFYQNSVLRYTYARLNTTPLYLGVVLGSNYTQVNNIHFNPLLLGVQGSVGPTGAAGINGSQGPQGNVGSQGPAGIAGSQGPQGAAGVAGVTGPAGGLIQMTQCVSNVVAAPSTLNGPAIPANWVFPFTTNGGTCMFNISFTSFVISALGNYKFDFLVDGVTKDSTNYYFNITNCHETIPCMFNVGVIPAGSHTGAIRIPLNTTVDPFDFLHVSFVEVVGANTIGLTGPRGATGPQGIAGSSPNVSPTNGEAYASYVGSISATTPAAATTILTAALPDAGLWEVTAQVNASLAPSQECTYGLFDPSGMLVPNSEGKACYIATVTYQGQGTSVYYVTTTGTANYTIRAWGPGGVAGCAIVNNAEGRTKVNWVRLGGYVGATGAQGAQGPQGAAAVVYQPNYSQNASAQVIYTTQSLPFTIISTSITTKGGPVQITVDGDANVTNTGGGWGRLQLARNGVGIGKIVQFETTAANVNVPYCLSMIDTPPSAGSYTYSLLLNTVGVAGTPSIQFGEADGPTLYAVEIGAVSGTGATTSNIFTGVQITAVTTNPTQGARSIDQVSYRLIGDKYRVCYRLGWAAGTAGSGDYLVTLPSGLIFNTNVGYNPIYSGPVWNPTINSMAPYAIPAYGGIVQLTNWNGQAYVVPYSSTKFRLVVDNNNTNSLTTWSSSWYTFLAEGMLNLEFEMFR